MTMSCQIYARRSQQSSIYQPRNKNNLFLFVAVCLDPKARFYISAFMKNVRTPHKAAWPEEVA